MPKITIYHSQEIFHLDEEATAADLLMNTELTPTEAEFDDFITLEADCFNRLDVLAARSEAVWIGRSLDDITRFVQLAFRVLHDPQEFCSYLLDIENTLAKDWQGPLLKPRDYIAGSPVLAPGLPQEGLAVLDQGVDFRLTHVLLQAENEWGINLPDQAGDIAKVAVFSGFVNKDKANQHVKSRKTFMEDGQRERGLWHGIHSHRLQILVLLKAFAKEGFRFEDGSSLTIHNLTALLIDAGIWGQLLDTNLPALTVSTPSENALHYYINTPQDYRPVFSATSPSLLSSFMMCFADQFGLPRLQTLWLKEHYHHSGLMFHRLPLDVVNHSMNHAGLSAVERVYYNMVSALWFSSKGPNIYSGHYAFNVHMDTNSISYDREYLAWAAQQASAGSVDNKTTVAQQPVAGISRADKSYSFDWARLCNTLLPNLFGKAIPTIEVRG